MPVEVRTLVIVSGACFKYAGFRGSGTDAVIEPDDETVLAPEPVRAYRCRCRLAVQMQYCPRERAADGSMD
jgi:hypothetical protein